MNSGEKKILVYYISLLGVRSEDIQSYMSEVSEKISANSVSNDTEIIFIPVQRESSVVCINPEYITDSDLIKKHERYMAELHEKLQDQVENLNEKDG